MNNPVIDTSVTYEPETDSRAVINHKLADSNSDLIKALTEIEGLNNKLNIEIRNNNIISNTNAQLQKQIDNQLGVIVMYKKDIERLEQEK